MTSSFITRGLLIGLLFVSFGCIGTQMATDVFLNQPVPGTSEVDLIKTYGMPDYSLSSGATSVHVYQVPERQYYVLYGWSEDVDMVVVCRDGQVAEVKNVRTSESMAILQPATWNNQGG